MIKGVGVSSGIAFGPSFILRNSEVDLNPAFEMMTGTPEDEKFKLDEAILKAKHELDEIIELPDQIDEIKEILRAHQMMMEDPELYQGSVHAIESGVSAYDAYLDIASQFCEMLSAVEDDYLKQRVKDIKDATQRVLGHIRGQKSHDLKTLDAPVIIVAEDVPPSLAAQFTKDKVLGIITEQGGETSHTAILANALGIPAVLGVSNAMTLCLEAIIVMDGETGVVEVNPTSETIHAYELKRQSQDSEREKLKVFKNKATVTKDGFKVSLYGNIGNAHDALLVKEQGGEGVGLFRTEFLFMDVPEAPSEDSQLKAYREALEALDGRPVIIRTLDAGGDKQISYLNMPKEENPFLGYRAIRYCLDHPELFKTQLRAIHRAAVYGEPKLMIPMISDLSEVLKVKKLVQEVKLELDEKAIPYRDVPIGIMIETPAAAVMADVLAEHVDFFSIGTNDLTQYTLAADRMNPDVKSIYSYFNPSVLRLIHQVIQAGNQAGIHVGMCGEAAGHEKLIPVLLAMGLKEFSMSPSKILKARACISRIGLEESVDLKNRVLKAGSLEDVQEILGL